MENNYELGAKQKELYEAYIVACEEDVCDIEDDDTRQQELSALRQKQKAAWHLYAQHVNLHGDHLPS